MERHEIPTHLNVEDRAFLGLTVRQLLTAAVGLALTYGLASDLPGPLLARLVAAAVMLAATALLALWQPAQRPLDDWAFVLLRYWMTPQVAVWRPGEWWQDDLVAGRYEVVLPAPGVSTATGPEHRGRRGKSHAAMV